MEEEATKRAAPTPRLLNLIRDEREWKQVREAEDGRRPRSTIISDAEEEDRKLELKLGLPDVVLQGEEDAAAARQGEKIEEQHEHEKSYTALSLGCFPTHSKQLSANTAAATGAKRGFFATVDANSEGCNQDREGCEDDLTGLTLGGGETAAGERKKGCCPPSSSHGSAARPMRSTNPQRRDAVPPVVGWPPVRSFRRNLTNGSSSKQSPERQNDEAADNKVKIDHQRSSLVKINMDGIPIGRKINLTAYDSFQELSSAIEDLFRGFLEAQKDFACDESREQGAEQKIFSGLLDGTGEYTLVYEDNRGGKTLARDLPWSVFSSTAKRLWVMRSSELPIGLVSTMKNASGRVADD